MFKNNINTHTLDDFTGNDKSKLNVYALVIKVKYFIGKVSKYK